MASKWNDKTIHALKRANWNYNQDFGPTDPKVKILISTLTDYQAFFYVFKKNILA